MSRELLDRYITEYLYSLKEFNFDRGSAGRLRLLPEDYETMIRVIRTGKNLKKLCLYRNNVFPEQRFPALVDAISANTSIKTLSINNMLVSVDVINALKRNTTLEELTIFDVSQDTGHALGELLKVNKSIKSLTVNSDINEDVMTPILNGLCYNSTVEVLNILSLNEISAVALGEMLKVNSTLKVLDVCGNYVRIEVIAGLAENKSITDLSIIGEMSDDDIWKQMRDMLLSNTSIQKLLLNDVRFSPVCLGYLVDGLEANNTVTTLDMSDNYITEDDIPALTRLVAKNTCLKNLILSHSSDEDLEMDSFFEALVNNHSIVRLEMFGLKTRLDDDSIFKSLMKNNTTLKELSLYDCNLGVFALINMMHGLRENSTLTKLFIGGNSFACSALIVPLSKMLISNKTLRKLSMERMSLGENAKDEDFYKLGEALRINDTLTYLDVSENDFTPEHAVKFLEYVTYNRGLTKLYNINNCGDGGENEIIGLIEQNKTLKAMTVDINADSYRSRFERALTMNQNFTFFRNMGNHTGVRKICDEVCERNEHNHLMKSTDLFSMLLARDL